MADKQRYEARRKPANCPNCGSSRVVEILYGFPDGSAFEEAEAGRLVLGGCCVGSDDPEWHCLDCSLDIHRDATAE